MLPLLSQSFQKLAYTLKNRDELIKAVEKFLQNTLLLSKTARNHDEMLNVFNSKQKNLLSKKAPKDKTSTTSSKLFIFFC